MSNRQTRGLHEPAKCKLCKDAGIVFVRTERTDIDSLAMRCMCDGKESKKNFWELPLYTSHFIMIDCPYEPLKKTMHWSQAADLWRSHMRKSKLIWGGDL